MKNLVIGVTALLLIVIGGFYMQKYKNVAKTTSKVEEVKWDIKNEKGNKTASIKFQLYNRSGGEVLGINDRISAVITDKQLKNIQHIKPQFTGNGTYKISYKLGKEGEYTVFLYEDNGKTTKQFAKKNFTKGEKELKVQPVFKTDTLLTKDIGGYKTSLLFRTLYVNEAATLTFQFQTEEREKLRLRSNAGEQASLYIVDNERKNFLHAVPVSEEGGQLQYYMTFPAEGVYKMWGTFYINGKKHKQDFTLQVNKRKES